MKHLLACKQIERMKNDIDYKSSIIKRLEAEIAQQNLKQKEEMDCVHAKFIAQIKNLESARDCAIQVIQIKLFL